MHKFKGDHNGLLNAQKPPGVETGRPLLQAPAVDAGVVPHPTGWDRHLEPTAGPGFLGRYRPRCFLGRATNRPIRKVARAAQRVESKLSTTGLPITRSVIWRHPQASP